MSQTESARLSAALFDEVLAPLADERRASGATPYFPAWKDAQATTYFVSPAVTVMTPSDFEFPGGGRADGLIDALDAWWRMQGDRVLADAAPRLTAIATALRHEAAHDDGSVDIFCYTLF